MLQIFAISFLLVGLPIIFSLYSLLGSGKGFVYSSMAFVLLLGMNYKKLLQFKLKLNISFLFLFLIILEFIVVALISNIPLKQIRDLFIILWLLMAVFTFNICQIKENLLLKTIFIISTLSIIMIYVSTSISMSYWAMNGGRIYIANTNNPSLIAWTAALNIISIFFILLRYKINFIIKLLLVILLINDLYLFFLAQSKSSIIGFGLIIFFYFMRYKSTLFFNKKFYAFFIFSLVSFLVYNEKVIFYFKLIYKTFTSLIYNSDTVMSAYMRYENFHKSFKLMSLYNIFGYGMNTFRMDSPILQTFIDFGNIMGLLVLIFFAIIPLYFIFIKRSRLLSIDEEFAILIYLFYFPNLFFHGTPYEWSTWLPVIMFYMFIKSKKGKIIAT